MSNQKLDNRSGGLLARLRDMPNETPQKMLIVTVSLCFVCAVIVSGAAVALRPLQEANKALERSKNILGAAGLLEEGRDIQAVFDERVEAKVVDLASGEYVQDIDPVAYDQRSAAKDPQRNYDIPAATDIAKIGRRARHASVYLVKREGEAASIVLPVHGSGLWSTLYGFLALKGDAQTVEGLSFYEHAETPGLGGEVDNPAWRGKWSGKQVFGENGELRIEVIKGTVNPAKPEAKYQIDGLAGATLTAVGVSNLIRYWVGEDGFGPFLARQQAKGG